MATHQGSSGKGTILLTGANGSLGSEMVSQMVSSRELSNYHGIYAVRDANTAPVLAAALGSGIHSASHPRDIISLDLADLASVRATAANINARVTAGEIPPLRAIFLNAGYLEFTAQAWTPDGFDMTFASNYLGHWLLALLLLQSMDATHGRIVVVGSESHDPFNSKSKAAFNQERYMTFMADGSEAIARGTWSPAKEDTSFHCGFRRYGASKFCQAAMVPELQRRLDKDPALSNVCVLGIDPGSMPTNLTRRGPWMIRILMFKLIMPWLAPLMAWLQPNGPLRTLKLGARDVIAAGLDTAPPLGESPKGMYLYGNRVEEVTPEARDAKKMERLWVDTVAYVQLKKDETLLKSWS